MFKISEISDFSSSKFKILFDNNQFLVVYKGMVDRSTLELSDEEHDELYKKMLAYGKKRAMNLLLKKNYSVEALRDKLEKDGYNFELISEIKAFLDSYHYLDDSRVAENLVRSYRLSKSKQEIKFLLKKQKLSDDVIEVAMDEFYDSPYGEESINNEMEVIKKLLAKKGYTTDRLSNVTYQEKNKLAASLYRKGFKSENIRKAINLREDE